MINIRNNIFETNSSSSHSLVIKPGCDYYTPEEVFEEFRWLCKEVEGKTGKYIIEPWGYEFEEGYNRYPFQVLDDFRNKLWYLYAHAPVRRYPPDDKHSYGRWTTEYYKVTNYLKKYLPWLEGISWKKCDCKPHSEAHGFTGSLKESGIDWYEYLFNKNIIVICDGDEYNVWRDLKKANLVRPPKGTKEYTYD